MAEGFYDNKPNDLLPKIKSEAISDREDKAKKKKKNDNSKFQTRLLQIYQRFLHPLGPTD